MTLLRIAHVLPSFEIGGQERVALDVARAHRAAGHRVLACTFLRGGEGPLAPAFREAVTYQTPYHWAGAYGLVVALLLGLALFRPRDGGATGGPTG